MFDNNHNMMMFQNQNNQKLDTKKELKFLEDTINSIYGDNRTENQKYLNSEKYYEYSKPVDIELAEKQLDQVMNLSENVQKAILHNKFASFVYQGQRLDKAEQQFLKAIEMIKEDEKVVFSNAHMNLANVYGAQKNFDKALELYKQVIDMSPHNPKNEEIKYRLFEYSKKLNSFQAYVDAHINLGVLLSNTGKHEEGFEYCEKALQLQPDNREALINLGDLMRQIGKKDQAIQYTWKTIQNQILKETEQQFEIPQKVDIQKANEQLKKSGEKPSETKNIVCVKWGTRYDSEYVNKLYRGIKNNTTHKFNFYCFTDNAKGLDENIIPKKLIQFWTKWWGKATLFSKDNGIEGQVFYIDLDMVVTGNIDDLLDHQSAFATLKTDYIECEQNHKDGYNSSVMIWHTEHMTPVYDVLEKYFDQITKYIVRFDFWLEMMVENADYLQEQFKGQISDYLSECQEKLPENTRIVCFPRKPKPEDYPSEWIKEKWV